MRPFDPRLLAQAQAARGYLVLTVCLGLAATILIIAQAGLLARALAGAARGSRRWRRSRGTLAALLLVLVAAGAAVGSAGEAAALRAAAVGQVAAAARGSSRTRCGSARLADRRAAGRAHRAGHQGLDSLDAYFARYLPQVLLGGPGAAGRHRQDRGGRLDLRR